MASTQLWMGRTPMHDRPWYPDLFRPGLENCQTKSDEVTRAFSGQITRWAVYSYPEWTTPARGSRSDLDRSTTGAASHILLPSPMQQINDPDVHPPYADTPAFSPHLVRRILKPSYTTNRVQPQPPSRPRLSSLLPRARSATATWPSTSDTFPPLSDSTPLGLVRPFYSVLTSPDGMVQQSATLE
ncbi:MAG: hypothetical protein Q9202_000924 [Teloschistes flavicans]